VVVSINGALVVVGADTVVALGLKEEERWEKKGTVSKCKIWFILCMIGQVYEEHPTRSTEISRVYMTKE